MSRRVAPLVASIVLIGAGVLCFVGAGQTRALAGFNNGTGPCSTGNGNYFGLTTNACPASYIKATTSTADSYLPGQTFSFTITVFNPTNSSISVPTKFGWHHILTILDSATGNPPLTPIDVSNGFTPAGFLPLTDQNFFAFGMFRGDTETETSQTTFTLIVPAHGSVALDETGSTTTCGYYELDLGGGGETLASGVARVLGCAPPGPTPTPTPTSTPTPKPTPTATPTPTSTPGEPTPSPTPTASVKAVSTPGTGGGMEVGIGITLVASGLATLGAWVNARRRRVGL